MNRILLAGALIGLLAAGCASGSEGGDDPSSTTVSSIAGTTTTAPETTITTGSSPTTSQRSSTPSGGSTGAPGECPAIGPARSEMGVGPVFVCDRSVDGSLVYGGYSVSRPGVDTAEGAVIAWLDGPNEQERAVGLQGWDLQPHPWFGDSLTFRREGTTLVMDLSRWQPINNLSTATGSAVFYTTLFGTVFSDPTVDQFASSIMGESCPVLIGETEWCFPIDWDDFVASLG